MKVSFCIPTYNRKEYLEELLESINNQDSHSLEIEVCISDNASIDDTTEAIDFWREKYSFRVIYFKHKKNIGPDLNYLSAVNMATGDYCWIFGSDDILSTKSLSLMEKKISAMHDIYLCDRRELDLSMTNVKNPHRKWLSCGSRIFSFKKNIDLINYFNVCNSIGGVFSYLSSIIVKREQWSSITFDNSYVNTAYSHVYILLSIINKLNTTLEYISLPLVDCRGDNDTFESSGKARRIKIDFVGYIKLQEDLYQYKPDVANAFGKVILRERPWAYTSLAMACYGDENDKKDLSIFYKHLGYNKVMTNFLFMWGKVAYFAKGITLVKNIVKKISH